MNLESAKRLGDRHLMPNDSFSIQLGGIRRPVRITVSSAVAGTYGGQHCLWMLTNLLARQFGVITGLEINVPESVPLLPSVAPFGKAPTLLETLVRTAELVAGDAMQIGMGGSIKSPAAEVLVGKGSPEAAFAVATIAEGWRFCAGRPEAIPELVPSAEDRTPFGPYFAACVGAGEVFKHLAAMRRDRGKCLDQLIMSLWDYREHKTWQSASAGEWPERLMLSPFYLAGVGAVGQAAVASLAACPDIGGYATLIDHEPVDDSNRNRYALAHFGNVNHSKVEIAAHCLGRATFQVHSYRGQWSDYVQGINRPQHREDVGNMERQWKFRRVLSCVDKNVPRHEIQNVYPEVILGGSTNECGIQVQAYDQRTDGECLKCANRLQSEVWTIEAEVDRWRKMRPDQRRSLAQERGLDGGAIEAYLSNPKCGHLGEQEIAKFGLQTGRQWSVGFVSVASGVLLAAKLAQSEMIGLDQTFSKERGNTLRFSFLNPGPTSRWHRQREECDCSLGGREKYRRLWT